MMFGMNTHPVFGAQPAALQLSELTVQGLKTVCRQSTAHAAATEAAVFIHGNPGSSEDWQTLMTDVSAIGRVVAFDMPAVPGNA
jgi:pimeloyl-ACP methyl ester carboxylesterase